MNDDNDENRKMVEQCYRNRKTMVNPIVDWSDDEVWEFLNDWVKVPHCCLYDEGFTRIGCIGCPLAGSRNMLRDFERWPKYKELYIKAFQKMIDNHPGQIKIIQPEYAEQRKEIAEQLGRDFVDIDDERNSDNPLERAGGGIANLDCNALQLIPPQERERSLPDGWKQERNDPPPTRAEAIQRMAWWVWSAK